MGGTRRLCLLSNSSHSKSDTKNENLCLSNDSSSPRVARDELGLGPDRPIHKTTIAPTSFGKPPETAIQSEVSQKPIISQSSLRYCLDKTKDLRQGNHLLFISFKNGLSGDIQRATISSWLKQTVMLAYQSFHLDTQNMSKVKAHDVCSTVSSLALKGGVSLDQILGACFWKSHFNFTNFT